MRPSQRPSRYDKQNSSISQTKSGVGARLTEKQKDERLPKGDLIDKTAIRMQVGKMLTFEELSKRPGTSELSVMRNVLQANQIIQHGCVSLPLTIMYAIFYMGMVFLHDDPTNTFMLESTIRGTIDPMFEEVQDIEGLWDTLMGSFAETFWANTNVYGEPLTKNGTNDGWGTWGRVNTYNQLQGAFRIRQSRAEKRPQEFGLPFNSNSSGWEDSTMMALFDSQQGFKSKGVFTREREAREEKKIIDEYCAGKGISDEFCIERAVSMGGRRLWRSQTHMIASQGVLPLFSKNPDDEFEMWLYPGETLETTLTRLQYFRERQWIDQYTEVLQIQFYLMNAELGRPRLEQVEVNMYFRVSGAVYYERTLVAIFLQFWFGVPSLLCDLVFISILCYFTIIEIYRLWKSFLASRFVDHVLQFKVAWEWLVLLAGWYNLYVLFKNKTSIESMVPKLQAVRDLKWAEGDEINDKTTALFEAIDPIAVEQVSLRFMQGGYSLMVMFRFFANFGVQPRLAIVTNTMYLVVVDLFHFAIVFIVSFFSYAITGNLIFGRQMEDFSTLSGSIATCFAIAMSGEYEWEDMSGDYWTSALVWVVTFQCLLIILMLNMLLAIILDVYNEVRQAVGSSEPVWTTMWFFGLRLLHFGSWAPYPKLEQHLVDMDKPIVHKTDVLKKYPHMPQAQIDKIFNQSQEDLETISSSDIKPETLLSLGGAVMSSMARMNHQTQKMNEEGADPLKSWVTPMSKKLHIPRGQFDQNFLTRQAISRGQTMPTFSNSEKMPDLTDSDAPDYLLKVHELLKSQRSWLNHIHRKIQEYQWNIQMAHLAKIQELKDLQAGEGEAQAIVPAYYDPSQVL